MTDEVGVVVSLGCKLGPAGIKVDAERSEVRVACLELHHDVDPGRIYCMPCGSLPDALELAEALRAYVVVVDVPPVRLEIKHMLDVVLDRLQKKNGGP